tara:strand:+ start:550 stop:1143 length:594 start_codon:yes stop_codon:yes gene_type:complete
MAKKLIQTNLSKSSTILYLLDAQKEGIKHSHLRNICFNVSSDGRSEWDAFKKVNPNKSPQGFYQTWMTSMVRKGLINQDAKTKKYSLSKLGKMNILKPNCHIDNLKRTPKQEIEYLKNRVKNLKEYSEYQSNRAWKYSSRFWDLETEIKELKNLITFHLDAPLDMVKTAVDIVVGDDGLRSKEVLEVLLTMKKEGQF